MRNKVVVNAIIKTAVMFTVLCTLIFGYFATSFGWFAKNESVKGSGISVSVEGISVEITQISSAGGVVDNNLYRLLSQIYAREIPLPLAWK